MNEPKRLLRLCYNRNPERFEPTFKSQQEAKYRFITEKIGPPESGLVLDLGSGINLFRHYSNWPTIGLDFADNLLLFSRSQDPDAPLVLADMDHLPFKDRSFSLIVGVTVIIDRTPIEVLGLLGEIRRVLKPAGSVILTILEKELTEELCDVIRRGPLNLSEEFPCENDRYFHLIHLE